MKNTKSTFDSGRIDFLGKAKYLVPFTLILTLFGLVEIATVGFDYGIDFAGGTEIQVRFQSAVDAGDVRKMMSETGYPEASVQSFGDKNEFLIRVEAIKGKDDVETNQLQNAMMAKVTDGLKEKFTTQGPELRRVDSVGPQVGDELKRSSILACVYSLLIILIYVGLRFDYKYAPGAVLCLFHDVIVTLSIMSIFNMEVNMQTLAAVLTLIGYSLNDTIITFDRIRENENIFRDDDFYLVANRSINDMLTRTVLTAATTLFSCAALFFLTDGAIRQIAFTLGVGVIVGTYSSIFVASPITIFFDRLMAKREAARMQAARA